MKICRYNRFTRLFLLSLAILMTALALYLGKSLAQPAPPITERVTILPDRIIPPPQMAQSVELTGYEVNTAIDDNIATTTVTQTYKNTSGQTLEARYIFPLPQEAEFSSFTLTVNGKALEGKIMEKEEARKTYEEIVRKLIDPGLLEYLDDKNVQVSIAPFFAGETKQVRLSYTQLLKRDGGLYKYRYFLGTQKPGTIHRPAALEDIRCIRYPCEPAQPRPQAFSSPALNLSLDLKTSQVLKTIYSPSHDPKIDRQGDNRARLKLTVPPGDVQNEKDFILYFSQDNGSMTLNTLNYKKAGEDGYFLMTLRAPDTLKTDALPKDIVLVMDTSGSMGGDKIVQAKEALRFIIRQLRPEDRFGLLQFNTDVSAFKNELVPASAANKQAALEYVHGFDASGSTHIEAALSSGFAQLKNHDPKRPAYVIFLTDGEPTVGVTDTEGLVKIAEKANAQHQAKLFSFGVGYDLNAMLLNKLSENNHGATTFIEPNENLELAVSGFYKKIEAPVLTGVTLAFEGVQAKKMYPEKIGDLFAGSEVILLGRYTGAEQGTAVLSGKVGSENKTYRFPLSWQEQTTHAHLPRLWAGRRIAFLLDHIRQHGENKELKDEVISLSKQYGIITPYTSFLSRESEQSYGGPSPAAAPMASQAAMDASSGQGAVQFSKRLNQMKAQASAQALREAQAPAGAGDSASMIRTVNGRSFVQDAQGVWVDTAYDEKTHGKPITVTFGTDAYFRLLAEKPELVPYFGLGDQVIVTLDGKAYQVSPAKAAGQAWSYPVGTRYW